MSNHIEEHNPSNKKLWVALGVSAGTIVLTAIGFAFVNNTNSSAPNEGSTETSQSAAPHSSKNLKTPVIESVAASMDKDNVTFSVKVGDLDTSKNTVQYEIADQDRVVKDKGEERSPEFDAKAKLSNSAYYRVKVRAVDETGSSSEWSENYTVKLEELEGVKTVKPEAAYYETGWAKGTDKTASGAKEAIEAAWDIDEVSIQEQMADCMPINTGDMSPTLLLPPMPATMPKDLHLAYFTNGWNGESINITYLWCQ